MRLLVAAGGIVIQSRIGAEIMSFIVPASRPVLCSECFTDHGLRLFAARIGVTNAIPCPNCKARESLKLTPYLSNVLAREFFVRGSTLRREYGSAPLIQCNKHHAGDIPPFLSSHWLRRDAELIGAAAGIGFFRYGPRTWMVGEVAPLKALQDTEQREAVIARIVNEYPTQNWPSGKTLYRLRVNPRSPGERTEFDSAPEEYRGRGRLDSAELSVMYCSQDIEGCAHECRATVEDDLYVATLDPVRELKLLDLTEVLSEEAVTEHDSLDIAVHMLFLAGDHSYPISRAIALAARRAGYDGILYPSYFSTLRSGGIELETVYGLSVRSIPGAAQYAKRNVFPNIALFGQPIADKLVEVRCVNRIILHKVSYDVRFGPVRSDIA